MLLLILSILVGTWYYCLHQTTHFCDFRTSDLYWGEQGFGGGSEDVDDLWPSHTARFSAVIGPISPHRCSSWKERTVRICVPVRSYRSSNTKSGQCGLLRRRKSL
ncbi:hypothetical protein B0H17DRAFT_1027329 [Mycena rosella]|uniref:Secreted protein n=1 Tax=Mycena rosella TaxID=1033263 RepID=A0AAD7H2U3_MYCRO|nr:hypothetical protein B0H17DRAFT_1027329 [Mycena rosella]